MIVVATSCAVGVVARRKRKSRERVTMMQVQSTTADAVGKQTRDKCALRRSVTTSRIHGNSSGGV